MSWRDNLVPTTELAASPLPTRQLKRMAARALARSLSSVQRIEEKKQRIITKKRTRAITASERHDIPKHKSSE